MTALATNLAAVTWDGLDLMLLDDTSAALNAVVLDVAGWYSTPDVDTHDVDIALDDGSVYGPKVAASREIVVSGYVSGGRDVLMAFRAALAMRTASTVPAQLTITDPLRDESLSATVRAGSGLTYEAVGAYAFRYEVTLLAADPRRYETEWESVVLSAPPAVSVTGRTYPRAYTWAYAGTQTAGTARLNNPGDIAAPVQAVYDGPLSETRLTNGADTIRVAPIVDGAEILVSTDTLVAQAAGGVSRASFILPGSVPMTIPPRSHVTWHLAGTDVGTVTLYWRGTYA